MMWGTERKASTPPELGECGVRWGTEREARTPPELGECGGHFWAPAYEEPEELNARHHAAP